MITFIPRDKVSKNWIIIAPILSIVFTIFFWFTNFYVSRLQPTRNSISNLCISFSQE